MKATLTIQEKGPSGKNTASHTYHLAEITGLDQAERWAHECLDKHITATMEQQSIEVLIGDEPTVPGTVAHAKKTGGKKVKTT